MSEIDISAGVHSSSEPPKLSSIESRFGFRHESRRRKKSQDTESTRHITQKSQDTESTRHRTEKSKDTESTRHREYQIQGVPYTESTRQREYQTQRVPDTESTRHREYQTQRLPDTENTRHREYQTQRVPDTESTRHREYQTQRIPDTESTIHREYQTQRAPDTESKRHREYQTQRVPDTGSTRHREYQTHRVPDTESTRQREYQTQSTIHREYHREPTGWIGDTTSSITTVFVLTIVITALRHSCRRFNHSRLRLRLKERKKKRSLWRACRTTSSSPRSTEWTNTNGKINWINYLFDSFIWTDINKWSKIWTNHLFIYSDWHQQMEEEIGLIILFY